MDIGGSAAADIREYAAPPAAATRQANGASASARRSRGVLVVNLGRVQGGLPILPDAVPDDGQFDIAVLKTRTVGDWVGVATRILVRSRKPGPQVDTFRARKVEIRCDRAQPVQFDVDSVEPTDRLALEIDPSSLTLAVPEHTRTRRPPPSRRTPTEHRAAPERWNPGQQSRASLLAVSCSCVLYYAQS
jgi:diacylglycerol kinase family enzyme